MKQNLVFVILFTLITTSACNSPGREPLSADEVETLAGEFEPIAKAHVEAWSNHDLETFPEIYTEDIIHYDGSPKYRGIDEVMQMADQIMRAFKGMDGYLGGAFISRDQVLADWKVWGVLGAKEEQPANEYDLLDLRDGKIAYWTLFYGPDFWYRFREPERINEQFLEEFSAAWSTGDPEVVSNLYAPSAILEDSLFRVNAAGQESIQDYVADFFRWYPGVTLQLEGSFAEAEPGVIQGGVFSIHVLDTERNPCQIYAAILLEPSQTGITKERLYYDADSLITCGWAQ